MSKIKAIILAGGCGSRLWPLSRTEYPKQLLKFDEQESLLQKTVNCVCSLSLPSFSPIDIATVTSIKHYADIKLQLDKLDNIKQSGIVIGEPLAKNTAPAIAATLEHFKRQLGGEDAVVLIVPSDSLLEDVKGFERTVQAGYALAEQGYIVTFGVKPTYPETGYGYIKTANKLSSTSYQVERFVEKPDAKLAAQYLADGGYYWNGGMFMGKISVFMEEFRTHAPAIYNRLNDLKFNKQHCIDYQAYEKMPSISIDYAIMEKSDKIALVELQSGWNDLGSWRSIYDTRTKDQQGNVMVGKVVAEDVKNSFIYSQKELVAVAGLEDIVLIETEDAIMACKMDRTQDVKKLCQKVQQEGAEIAEVTKVHKTVFRPWGYYTCMSKGKGYLTKTICVMPQQKLSVQSHNHRSEHWVVLEGQALVYRDGKTYNVYAGESIDIPLGIKHSLQNPFDEELKIIEVQKGDYLSEDDIVRYEDCYGRV